MTAAAQTRVHPVSAHLLPLGINSALKWESQRFILCTNYICTIPDVALLYSPRTEDAGKRCSEAPPFPILGSGTAPPVGPHQQWGGILGDWKRLSWNQRAGNFREFYSSFPPLKPSRLLIVVKMSIRGNPEQMRKYSCSLISW